MLKYVVLCIVRRGGIGGGLNKYSSSSMGRVIVMVSFKDVVFGM